MPSSVNDDVNLINFVLDLVHRNECDGQHCSISDTFFFHISVTMSNSEGFKFLILIDKQITFCQVLSSNGPGSAHFCNIICVQLK